MQKFLLTNICFNSPLTGLFNMAELKGADPRLHFLSQQHCNRMFQRPVSLLEPSSLNCWRLHPPTSGSQWRVEAKEMLEEPVSIHLKVNSSLSSGCLLCPLFTSVNFPVSWKWTCLRPQKAAADSQSARLSLLLSRGLFRCQYDPWAPFRSRHL